MGVKGWSRGPFLGRLAWSFGAQFGVHMNLGAMEYLGRVYGSLELGFLIRSTLTGLDRHVFPFQLRGDWQ